MKYIVKTYGCQMNIHESEKIAGVMEKQGYTVASSEKDADVIIFNTCCIRDTAEKKIMGNIGDIKALKKLKPSLKLIICGCMTQQDSMHEELLKKYPYIDIITGTNNINNIPKLLNNNAIFKKKQIDINKNIDIDESEDITRTSFPNAWVNIMLGCNNFCSYCIVPYVRGRERSRKAENIISEIEKLLSEGYKEITLLGQNVNSYGNDVGNDNNGKDKYNFTKLLKAIANLPYKFRLRFMTSHPKDLSDEVLKIMSQSDNISKCLHLPIQSGSNRILSLMNRKYTREDYLKIVDYARELMPNLAITTDIMVGFPGELEEDFMDTVDLVKRVRFSSAFTFVYSKRKGTPASLMEQVPSSVKKERITALIADQNKITRELSQEYIGNTYEVLAEDISSRKPNYICCRTDCGRLITFLADKSIIGQYVNVLVTSAASASLFGDIVID